MYEVNSCYQNGDISKALEEAAEVIRRIGEENVLHVIARRDDDILGAWWVDVVYRETHQRHSVTGVSMPSEWTNP